MDVVKSDLNKMLLLKFLEHVVIPSFQWLNISEIFCIVCQVDKFQQCANV